MSNGLQRFSVNWCKRILYSRHKSIWKFPEVFEYLIKHYPWETMIYLTRSHSNVTSDPTNLKMERLRSNLLDDTIRQLVHTKTLGEKSEPLRKTRQSCSKNIIIEPL